MHRVLRASGLVLLSLLPASVAFGQKVIKPPTLHGGADATDWEAYYDEGIARLWRDPKGADAYFAYATHLRPDRAEPLYGRFITYHSRDLERFVLYLRWDAKTLRDPEVIAAESFRERALRRNPFVHQGLLMFLIDRMPGKFKDDPVTRAWIHLGNGELPQALRLFGDAIKREPKKLGYLRYVRASAFINSNRPDSALIELDSLLAQQRAGDIDSDVGRYESKELLEYARGLILSQRRRSLAKEAFGSAIAENVAFAPAHSMLAQIALLERDTTTALAELELAVSTDSTDVELLINLGKALGKANRFAEARTALRKATDLEPLYALPHYYFATIAEADGDKTGAVLEYKRFLRMSALTDALRAGAEARLAALK
jgi:predicted Zn-dependent protease